MKNYSFKLKTCTVSVEIDDSGDVIMVNMDMPPKLPDEEVDYVALLMAGSMVEYMDDEREIVFHDVNTGKASAWGVDFEEEECQNTANN